MDPFSKLEVLSATFWLIMLILDDNIVQVFLVSRNVLMSPHSFIYKLQQEAPDKNLHSLDYIININEPSKIKLSLTYHIYPSLPVPLEV